MLTQPKRTGFVAFTIERLMRLIGTNQRLQVRRLHRLWPRAVVLLLSAAVVPVSTPVPLAWAASKASVEAGIVAKQALQYYNAKQWAIAAELYRRAYRIDPTKPEYLFGVGRAEQRAGRYKEAILAFETLLTILPVGDGFRAKVEGAVAETRAQKAEAEQKAQPVAQPEPEPEPEPGPKPEPEPEPELEPGPKPKPEPVAEPAKPAVAPGLGTPGVVGTLPAAEPNLLGWGLVAGGGALAFTGLGLGISVLSNGSDWTALMEKKNEEGQITGTDWQTATKMAGELNQRSGLAIGLGVAGVAVAGVGVWLLVKTPGKVAVMPTGRGLLFSVGF